MTDTTTTSLPETKSSASSGTDTARNSTGNNRYPWMFRLLHWVLPVVMVALILSGFEIHRATYPGYGGPGIWGRVPAFHVLMGAIFAPSLLACAWMSRKTLFRTSQRTLAVLMLLGIVSIITGVMMLSCPMPAELAKGVLSVHSAVLGRAFIPVFLLWHVIRGLTLQKKLLVPSLGLLHKFSVVPLWWIVPLAVATTLVIFGLPGFEPSWQNLVVTKIDAAPGSDAATGEIRLIDPATGRPRFLTADTDDAADPAAEVAAPFHPETLPWDKANVLSIGLVRGTNFDFRASQRPEDHGRPRGMTTASLAALHDGTFLWVRAEWDDPREDRKYTPWEKTADGWKRHKDTRSKDPVSHYEDKFSIVFPIGPNPTFDRLGCLAYCHLDPSKGWGYKGLPRGSDRRIDVWHWKAARSTPVGQCDDKYWTGITFPENSNYGRVADPQEEGNKGGYSTNESSEHPDAPLMLPRSLTDVQGDIDLGVLPKGDELLMPYDEEVAGKYEQGTIIPGILVSPFTGDRGDVAAWSKWEDGKWTLYLRRKLDTGSGQDVKFEPGGTYPFAVGAFDNAGKRHAYHYPVYRMVMPKS